MCLDNITEGMYVILNERLEYLAYLDPLHLKCTDELENFWYYMEIINYFNGFSRTGRVTVVTEGIDGDDFVKFNRNAYSQWLVVPADIIDDEVYSNFEYYMKLGNFLNDH